MAPVPAATDTVDLSITPITPDAIPSRAAIEAAARALLDSTSTWKRGKKFAGNTVQALSRPKGRGERAGWHARLSTHAAADGAFAEFWDGLSVNKAEREAQFVPEIHDTRLLRTVGPGQEIWSLHYVFPAPLTPRVFTVLQTIFEDAPAGGPRTGWCVSMPVDVSGDAELAPKDFSGVRGRYVSIERVREAGAQTEWIMATSSTPGGNIPGFVAELSMDGQIAHDVPRFVAWLKKHRSTMGDKTMTAAPPAPAAT